MKKRRVEIKWEDANANHGWSNEPGHIAPSSNVGYLISETKHQVTICFGIGRSQLLCVLAIPRSCIKEIKELEYKE